MADRNEGTVHFLFEMGMLKRAKRTGWWIAGVKDPETIAEHSFRVALIGATLAYMEGADAGRVALLCTLHDTQETRVGDIPWVGRRYVKAASNSEVTRDQLSQAHPAVAAGFQAAVDEYEAAETREAKVARDADKLECMLQGLEYLAQGIRPAQEWVDSTRAKLMTPSAIELADAAQNMSVTEWQRVHLP